MTSEYPNQEQVPASASPSASSAEAARQPEVQGYLAQFAGPLPPSAEFERYEKALPGAADRILAMAEKEQAHRHAFSQRQLEGLVCDYEAERRQIRRGQTLGLVVSLVLIGCGTTTAIIGSVFDSTVGTIVGGILGSGGLAPVIAAFIGKRPPVARDVQEHSKGDIS